MDTFITSSAEETKNVGKDFAMTLSPGAVVALRGDLGVGKTVFVKGVAEALNCTDDILSPTFTLVNECGGEPPLYHFDVYRLENPSIDQCDWIDDYLFGDGVCLIEWADNIAEILPDNTVYVEINKLPEKGADYREIKIVK